MDSSLSRRSGRGAREAPRPPFVWLCEVQWDCAWLFVDPWRRARQRHPL